jgi:flagellar hook protein FlgE
MDALSVQVDALIADARRAATPGGIGDAPDRAGAIIAAPPVAELARRSTPSDSPLSVTIDGNGMFVFEDAGRRVFGRLGDFRLNSRGVLVDGAGRAVLGYSIGAAGQAPDGLHPMQIASNDGASKLFSDYAIDEHGTISGIVVEVDSRTGERRRREVPLGRIALALFPAPERLHRAGDTIAIATPEAGPPSIVSPGDPNVGTLRSHVLENGLVDLERDFARLWSLQRRADLDAATAWAADGCTRTAMGLVK